MKRRIFLIAALPAWLAAGIVARAANNQSEVSTPEQRHNTVAIAERLARPQPLPPLPADVPQPFSPAGFDQPDASEAKDKASGTAGASKGPAAPVAPPSDRDVLATVAAKIPTTGTIILDGRPLLISGMNRIEVGSRFTVLFNGQEYELELIAVDRTTFTVRYKGEEFTRPIKLGRSP